MKYKKIILYFCIALPTSVLMRILQLFYTVDFKTGFFKPEYNAMGFYLLMFIMIISLIMAILSFTTHRSPDKPPKINLGTTVASFGMAVCVTLEVFDVSSSKSFTWQNAAVVFVGFFTILFFAGFGISGITGNKLPPILTAIPMIYFAAKTIAEFTAISTLALISDNVLLLAGYCTSMLFMLCMAKLNNKVDMEYNFRKLMASGFASVIICATQSIPNIITDITTNNNYTHTSDITNVSMLMTGIFIAVYTLSYFSYNNLTRSHIHQSSDFNNDNYYFK